MSVPRYAPGVGPVSEGTEPVTLPVQIVQATEVKHGVPLYPVITKDFGQVLMDSDKTFSASISFEDAKTPTPPEPGKENPGKGGSGSDAPRKDGGSTDSPTGIEVLSDTGEATPLMLGAAALLIAGALLFAGLRSTGLLRRR